MKTVLISGDLSVGSGREHPGIRTIYWPPLQILPPDDWGPVDEAIQNLFGYDWLILKNPTAADSFLRRLQQLNHTADELDELRLLVVGDLTARTVRQYDVHIDIELERFRHDDAAVAIAAYAGGREYMATLNCVVPSAALTTDRFENELDNMGARIDRVAVYRTTRDTRRLSEIKALLAGGAIEAIVFLTRASVEDAATLCDTDDLVRWFPDLPILCANEQTREIANRFGLDRTIVFADDSPQSLYELIITL